MVQINQLSDNKGARKNRIRVGRGIGSGKGKTCARGVKGQKSRSGVAIKGFEGGQMPIFRRLPKRGFTNIHRTSYETVNVSDINSVIESKKLDAKSAIDADALCAAGLVRSSSSLIKLLGDGEFEHKGVSIHVNSASKSAVSIIEASGSTVSLV